MAVCQLSSKDQMTQSPFLFPPDTVVPHAGTCAQKENKDLANQTVPDTTCLGLAVRTAEKRPGVVGWFQGSMGRQSYASPIGCVWEWLTRPDPPTY